MVAAEINIGDTVRIKGRRWHYEVIDLDALESGEEFGRVKLKDRDGQTAWGPLSKVEKVATGPKVVETTKGPVIDAVVISEEHSLVYDKVTGEFTKPWSGWVVRARWGNVDRTDGFGMSVNHLWEAEMIGAALVDGGIFDVPPSITMDNLGKTYVSEQWITTGRYICAELKRRGYKGKTVQYVYERSVPPWAAEEEEDDEIDLDSL
jgi:hypothetical protein